MTARAEEPSEEGPPVCESCGPGKTVVFDTREVFKAPVRWRKPDWRSVGIKAAVVVGSLTLLDEPVRDYVQDHKGNTTERIANAFEPFGAEYAIGALADSPRSARSAASPRRATWHSTALCRA